MTSPGRIQQLRALPIFAELPGPSLERIAAMATEVELRPGAGAATRSARVRAATPVRCLAVSRADFEALLESEPALAVSMLRTLARRLLKEIGAYESD